MYIYIIYIYIIYIYHIYVSYIYHIYIPYNIYIYIIIYIYISYIYIIYHIYNIIYIIIYIYILCTSIINSYAYRLMVYILYPFSIQSWDICLPWRTSAGHRISAPAQSAEVPTAQRRKLLGSSSNSMVSMGLSWFIIEGSIKPAIFGGIPWYTPVSGELT